MIDLYPDYFNDVFGPLMQPGSSSHTAGPCRLGYLCSSVLGSEVSKIVVQMDPNGSFAGIFGAMSEDLGMIAGALGYLPDDIRMFQAKEICRERGISVSFELCEIPESAHVNALRFVLTAADGHSAVLVGNSVGGGMVETVSINGYPYSGKGDTDVIFVFDPRSQLSRESLLEKLSGIDCMDAGTSTGPDGRMHWIKAADVPAQLPELEGLAYAVMKSVLPVGNNSRRKSQLFDSVQRWRELADEQGIGLYEVALQYEMGASGWDRERVIQQMCLIRDCMHRQTHAILEEGVSVLETEQDGNHYRQWDAYCQQRDVVCGDPIARALRYAYAARATAPGVLFVPGPMGRGGGFIYAVLCAVQEIRGCSDEDLLRGLFIAAGIGAICYTRSAPTGEVIGCAGECGVCMAMAAAGLSEMLGCSPGQVETAASLAMESAVGWPCDPIPGGYWQPCGSRITTAVSMAIVFADLARSGKSHVLPFHEVLDVADSVGRNLGGDLHCTGRGGHCTAPTAVRCAKAFRQSRVQESG